MGDYVNAELLGNPQTRMIGNVIQNRFLVQNDYPVGSALSFILMAGDPGGRGGLRPAARHRAADRLMATTPRPPAAPRGAARAAGAARLAGPAARTATCCRSSRPSRSCT